MLLIVFLSLSRVAQDFVQGQQLQQQLPCCLTVGLDGVAKKDGGTFSELACPLH